MSARTGRAVFWLALLAAASLGLLIVCQAAEAQLPRPIYPAESALNHVGIEKWAKLARIGRTVTVATTRGDYTSLATAVAYVTTQTPSAVAPWVILVYDGDHSAAPVALPAWVSVIFLGGVDDDGDRSGLAVRTGAGYTFGLKVNGSEVTGGGGAGNSFVTINAPTGTDPAAESATDTLNLTCSGLTCTGTAGTDTLDIAVADDGVALGTKTTGGYAASVSEAGPATTATALAANGSNCSAGSWSAGVDASGEAEGCTADDDTPEAAEFGALALTGPVTSSGLATTIAADAVALGTQTTGPYAASSTEGGAASSVAADSVALTTDTTGPYLASATASQGLTVTGTEGASVGLQDCAASETLKRNAGDTAWECAASSGGVTDHGALTGLSDDDHAQYAAVDGRAGGTVLTGGTNSGDAITIRGNSATNTGSIKFSRGSDNALILELYNAGGARFYKNAIPDNGVGPEVNFGDTPSSTNPTLRPASNDGNTGIGWSGSDQLAMIAGGTEIARHTRSSVSTTLDLGQAADTPQAATCTDTGDANPGALTINPTTSLVYVTVSDADGCAVTIGETNVSSGVRLQLVTVAGAASYSDTSGVTELAGAFVAGVYDALTLRYISDRWVETGRSDN